MSIALHIDGRRMCSLRRDGQRVVGRQCPAIYIAVPPSNAEKRLLERARIPYAMCEGSTIILGQHAAELAPLLRVPRLPILPGGRLPEDDPLARQLAAAVVEALLPPPPLTGARCGLALPPQAETRIPERTREWEFFSRLIRLRGYRPLAIAPTTAISLAELGHTGFTGIVLAMDSASTALVVTHLGAVLTHAQLPFGGDWIDEHLARKTERLVYDMEGTGYVDLDAVAHWKDSVVPALNAPQNDEAQLLAYIYQQLLRDAAAALAQACRDSAMLSAIRAPLPLVCCGQPTLLPGFSQLLSEQIERVGLPFDIAQIRVVGEPDFTIARGCLIQTELESLPAAYPRAA